MLPPIESVNYQDLVLKKIKEVHDYTFIGDRLVLMSIFYNFRTGGGLRLSEQGYDICKKHNLYQFFEVQLHRDEQTSIVYTSLDRVCKSPYYVKGNVIYLSDQIVLTHYTLCGNNFKNAFETFM